MLALSRDGPQIVPTPNYAQNAVEVFKAVSRDMIVTRGQTALTLLAGHRQDPPCSPSWIPLWFPEDDSLPPWINDRINKHQTQFEPKARMEYGQLSVPAFLLESITHAGPLVKDPSESALSQSRIKSTSETIGVLYEISSLLLSCNDSRDVPSRTTKPREHML